MIFDIIMWYAIICGYIGIFAYSHSATVGIIKRDKAVLFVMVVFAWILIPISLYTGNR